MRSRAPALLPSFRSRLQAEPLTLLILNPGGEFTRGELAARLHAALTSVHDEVGRLTSAQLLARRKVGRSVLVRVNERNRLVEPLREIVTGTWGHPHVVAAEFGDLEEVERVLIFESWADRYHQGPGSPPHDVDVLVVGDPPREHVFAAAERAEEKLGMPVNPVVRTSDQWRSRAGIDALVDQIRGEPFVDVSSVPDLVTAGLSG